jgi:fibronectin-binding autotransporter adhesin
MKTTCVFAPALLAALSATPALAVEDIWDGGGADNLVTNGLNWADNSAPVSNLATTDLIFGGNVRLTPNFPSPFSADYIGFSATAGAFNLTGATLTLGASGVDDFGAGNQTISAPVTVGTPTTNIQANVGSVTFGNILLNSNTITSTGSGNVFMNSLSGNGTFIKNGAGTVTINATGTALGADFNLNSGTTQIAATGVTQTFASTSTVTLNGGNLAFLENAIFDAGAQLIRVSGTPSLAAGKALTFQGGSDFTAGADYTLTGGNITTTGAGSQMTSSGSLFVQGGSILSVQGGALLSVANQLNLGHSGNGSVVVNGVGSTFTSPGFCDWRGGSLTASNGASVSLGGIQYLTSSSMNITVNSGAVVNQNGGLNFSGGDGSSAGISVSGAGSSWTQTSPGGITIGRSLFASGSVDLGVSSGGVFTAGSSITVHENGEISIGDGGTLNAAGISLEHGGQFTRSAAGVLNMPPGTAISVTDGSIASFVGEFATNGMNVSLASGLEPNSRMSAGTLTVSAGSTVALTDSLDATTQLSVTGDLKVGANASAGTLTSNRSQVIAGSSTIGSGGTGNVTFSNTTTATLGLTRIGADAVPNSGGTVEVLSGAAVTSSNLFIGSSGLAGSSGSLTLDGGGTAWNTSNGTTTIGAASGSTGLLTLANGGSFQPGTGLITVNPTGTLDLGTSVIFAVGGMLVDGGQLNAGPQSDWRNHVSIRNGGTATMGALGLADSIFGLAHSASLDVAGGSSVTVGNLRLATPNNGNTATLTVEDAGSSVTQTGASTLIVGSIPSTSTALLEVKDGGAFTTGTGDVTLNATGTLHIDGGTLTLNGPVSGNGGTFDFDAGVLVFGNPAHNIHIGTGSVLGTSFMVDAARELAVAGTLTVDAFRTLTLDGGTLRAGVLVDEGTFDFRRGTFAITGAGGFSIGSGALGSNVTLGTGANLQVTNTAAVAPGALLRVNGGSFSCHDLNNFGTLDHRDGVLDIAGQLTNVAGAWFFLSARAAATGPAANAGTLVLQNGIGLLGGAGTLTNSGLITGDGVIAKPFLNSGEVRAEAGRTLFFLDANGQNTGRCILQGGTLFYAQPFINAAAGQINGHGALYFPAEPVPVAGFQGAGLDNLGQFNLSGGDTLVFGTVSNNAGGRIIASGGSTASFFDVFRHAGGEVKASAGSALVFFGEVRGPGSFTGSGTIYMEGGYSPGASPASVSIAPQMIFTDTNVLTLEIGGLAAGTQHDKLFFTHAASPQVTWGGALTVTFINGFVPAAGHSFDVLDFDAARAAGTFSGFNLPSLPVGLTWDTSQFYTTGTITVVTERLTFAAWAAASGIPGALPGGDHDSDGYVNATEFALGLFPPQPGTVEPNGGFHAYVDGESLRLLFTRPLDRTGVTLKVQASSDLVNWTDVAVSVDSASFTGSGFVSENREHPLSEPGLVGVRDILNAAIIPRRQMRLRIEIAP